jgi:hypothetical protein
MNHKDFNAGVEHGKNKILVELLEHSDKLSVIMALFRKTHILADQETDPIKKNNLEAYSEGFRHSLNILENLGDALEAYRNVINPSIKISISQEDINANG